MRPFMYPVRVFFLALHPPVSQDEQQTNLLPDRYQLDLLNDYGIGSLMRSFKLPHLAKLGANNTMSEVIERSGAPWGSTARQHPYSMLLAAN